MTQAFEDTSVADAGLDALLNKGRRSGSVSAEDVLEAIPDTEVSAEKLSSVVSQLSADDEKRLSRAIEEWLHIEAILEEHREEHGEDPTWGEVFVELLREFQ